MALNGTIDAAIACEALFKDTMPLDHICPGSREMFSMDMSRLNSRRMDPILDYAGALQENFVSEPYALEVT